MNILWILIVLMPNTVNFYQLTTTSEKSCIEEGLQIERQLGISEPQSIFACVPFERVNAL